jgi:hypothetical protein
VKKGIVFSLSAAVLISSIALYADEVNNEKFYRACIESKIEKCELKSKFANSRGESLRVAWRRASDEAEFFRGHQDELVSQMVAQKIDKNTNRVEYFLIKAYFSDPSRSAGK